MSMTKEETQAIKDIIWMARRYANGRKTYAVSLFNDAYDTIRDSIGDSLEQPYDPDQDEMNYYPYAEDGMERFNESVKDRKYSNL